MGRKTQVYEYLASHGKIVDYAGFDLPVWFEGIIAECKSVRNQAGIFDVSHMGRVLAEGPDAKEFLNRVTTNDVSSLTIGRGQYSLFCNPKGGIIDDLTVFRTGPENFLVVYNAGNRSKDWEWLHKNKGASRVVLKDVSDDVAMFAVQGPRSGVVLRNVCGTRLEEIERYGTKEVKVGDAACLVTRSGYTGEDGFEIYVWNTSVKNPKNAVKVWETLLEGGRSEHIRPAGLGARDVLRLEAGMCLYGNDLDEATSPVEARLNWVVKLDKGEFLGKESIQYLRKGGPQRVRVGFKAMDKGIPRQDQPILSNGHVVGKVTSGTFSPTLKVGLGMGFVKSQYADPGESLKVRIRERDVSAEVVKLPFYNRRSEDAVLVFGEQIGLRDFRMKYGT